MWEGSQATENNTLKIAACENSRNVFDALTFCTRDHNNKTSQSNEVDKGQMFSNSVWHYIFQISQQMQKNSQNKSQIFLMIAIKHIKITETGYEMVRDGENVWILCVCIFVSKN